jgi:glycosyltransferase involved in cell wall biosynthesis
MHPNKGFDIYKHLDEKLDWDRYEMTFVGNSPIEFKKIKHIKAQPADKLAQILRAHDVFITASRHEACSNALLEALACGLPVVAIASGSNAELMGDAGVSFTGYADVISAIGTASERIENLRLLYKAKSIRAVAAQYRDFLYMVSKADVEPKWLSALGACNLYRRLGQARVHDAIVSVRRRLRTIDNADRIGS